jgi:hypothetical protein
MIPTKDDVIEAVSIDLLEKGYSVLKKPAWRRRGADLVARDPDTKKRLLISAAGHTRAELAKAGPHAFRTEPQLLTCMTRSVYSALRLRHEEEFGRDDEIVLAFPDIPSCQKYLAAEKSVLNALGVKVLVVKKDKEVTVL